MSNVKCRTSNVEMSVFLLQVSHIYKSFDGAPLLRDVSFDVAPSEVVCLLGPSGCGKTTLLRIIAGLEQSESGQVLVEGQDTAGTPVHKRGFGLMFQDLALFPHKNVRDNVAFGLRMANLTPSAIDVRVQQVLELVGLSGFEQRDVNQLSGGEQQRVALARSLAPRPRLLMLDEPLTSLDRTLRERLMNELRDILTRVGQTAIYVTHDQQEAFALADRVVILSPRQGVNAGRVAQIGTPQEVYRRPADAFVARFLGLTNLVRGRWSVISGQPMIQTKVGAFKPAEGVCHEGEVTVLIRPDAASLDLTGLGDLSGLVVDGALVERSFRGGHTRIVVRANGTNLEFEMDSTTALPPVGSPIRLVLRPDAITCLPA
jgi:ABC-type Fe3+/spermidine/putrescine transport system ATPase subunit